MYSSYRLAQLVNRFNQGSFPSCRAVQRAVSQLGALWKCKSSRHIYIFCALFAQIPSVLNNVIRSSPKSKAVPEIKSLSYGIEKMSSEKKVLRKERKATASMRKAQATLKPWKKSTKIAVSCCPTYFGCQGWSRSGFLTQKRVRKLQTNTGDAAVEMSCQDTAEKNKSKQANWESKNTDFLTLTNLFVPEHLDRKFYPGEIFLQFLTDFFSSCPFSQIRDLIFNSILVHTGAY